jgi:hypothetical protein
MANEITILAGIKAQKGSFSLPQYGGTRQLFDMTGLGGGVPGLINVGQVAEQLDLTELEDPGFAYLRNIDATQTVRWAFSSGGLATGGILRPGGGVALIELGEGAELWVQVDPATEESGSTSAENQAKVQAIALER